MINVSGMKVFPDEVDSVLMAHDAILEAATIGIPDPKVGETVKSFIVLQPGASRDADGVKAYAAENLANYKVPRHVEFMDELRGRLANRVQLTTDGHKAYLEAVEGAFGGDVDYAQLIKLYGEPTGQKGHERKYSPSECTGTKEQRVEGSPDPKYVSTSHVERQNLTMRMHMRRFTRLTNAFSKKFENHMHMVALYTVWYNFIRIHKTLRVTPAMEAGLSETVWDMDDLVAIMEERAPKPGRPKTYKKRGTEISK